MNEKFIQRVAEAGVLIALMFIIVWTILITIGFVYLVKFVCGL